MITLKSTLLYYLKCFLARLYKDDDDCFIEFLHNRKPYPLSEPAIEKIQDLSWHQIPLQKHPSDIEVLYTSALPQMFQKALSQQSKFDHCLIDLQEITSSFTKRLQAFQLKVLTNDSTYRAKTQDETQHVLSTLWQAFTIESNRPGWISFRLSNDGLYTWINQIQTISQMADENHTLVINKPLFKPVQNSSTLQSVKPQQIECAKAQAVNYIWQAQYTHARCCSLMRSWQRLSSIQSQHYNRPKEALPEQGAGVNQEEALATLQAFFSPEKPQAIRQLIQALIKTADDMFWQSERYLHKRYPHKETDLLLKQVEQLHLAFDQFHRANPIVLSQPQPFPYLMLVNGTRNLLALLLHSYLQVTVPEHL